MEVKESAEGILAESLHLPYHLFKRFPLRKASRFGKEFIGIADKFLFQGNGTHIPMREGEILPDNILHSESGSGVSFAYESMSG